MHQDVTVRKSGGPLRSGNASIDHHHGVRVLVVDDDDAIRESVRSALEDSGYEVAEAADGLAALAALRTDTRSMVVLLDLRMPNVDGAGVLGVVAADRALTTQHAYVLMSASLQTLTLPFANLLSQLDVPMLKKPFELDTLLDVVERAARRLPIAQA
jgi:CheY-like chemotaxis protein